MAESWVLKKAEQSASQLVAWTAEPRAVRKDARWALHLAVWTACLSADLLV